MSDLPQPTSTTFSAAPTEIDARHAQQLLERALSQLERGERGAAETSVRQAIHLSPGVTAAHSLVGLVALLGGDLEAARIGYENAVPDFSKASPERERLIALRMSHADNSGVNASDFVPSLPQEIQRLRAAVAQTSMEEFLSLPAKMHHAAPRAPLENSNIAAPSPLLSGESKTAARPAFEARLEQRKRASTWAVGIAAISAAIVAFFVMRSLTSPAPAPQAGSTPVANQVVVETPPQPENANNSAGDSPALGGTGSTPSAQAPASNSSDAGSTPTPPEPTATVTVRPLPPTPTAPVATPRPAPKPTPKPERPTAPPAAAPIIPGLPRPAPKPTPPPRVTPAPTPAPRETPRDPNFPAMPPPKITLPSAGGEKTEFPRVLPDND